MLVAATSTSSNFLKAETNTTMTVNPLDKLKASIWVRNISNIEESQVIITFYNSLNAVISTATSPYVLTNTSGWANPTITAVAPAGTVRAQLAVNGKRTFVNVASMYVDNAKLENLTDISTSHYCLDNITLRYDSDLLVNKVKVTETNSGTTATATNTASVTANGEQSGNYSVTYDAAGSPTTLANLATRISNSATIKQVSSITTPAVRDDGTLSFVLDYDIAYTIQVEFAQDPLPPLQVVSLISRIRHNITPEYWSMNIDLWRGI
jgi:hypothetical protein